MDKKFLFIGEEKGSKLLLATCEKEAQVEVHYTVKGDRTRQTAVYDFEMLIDVKGWKALETNFLLIM